MNHKDAQYKNYALVQEMLETPSVIDGFNYDQAETLVSAIQQTGHLMLTGEGSSRIFPAKNFMTETCKAGILLHVISEGARQAHECRLDSFVVIGASNSGQTKEVISLFQHLKQQGHNQRFGLTATADSRLEAFSNTCYLLKCGKENAVAATKSVVEQALFYQAILCHLIAERGGDAVRSNQRAASEAAAAVLEAPLDGEMIRAIAGASTIYFAGRNNGVAEELTLKTNEITRMKSDYLEGTYAVHGVEEVMDPSDVVILMDPFEQEEQKIRECLAENIGIKVFAVASRDTLFPTIKIPDVWGFSSFLQLLAGWNILVEVGIHRGIHLDKPTRARKVGNEFIG